LPDDTFDGVIFGFNGLMLIPGRENRRRALSEIQRVLVPQGCVVFTAHDRDAARNREYWKQEQKLWEAGQQNPGLGDFGDRIHENAQGRVFVHFPDRQEVLADLELAGLNHVDDFARADICNEAPEVREFSDECRFWIALKRT
jgi:SAM-dependent methyltransferase